MRLLILPSFFWLFFSTSIIFAQETYQDCMGSLPICSPLVQIETPSQDYGFVVESDQSCLSFEGNSHWFRLRAGADGQLCFSLLPFVETDNFDWALYDLTGRNCVEIRERQDWLVACNSALAGTCEGRTGFSDLVTCESFAACLPVRPNQEFVLRVEAEQGTQSGFTLDFSESTTTFIPPVDTPYIDAPQPCYGQSVPITVNPIAGGEVYWYDAPDAADPFFKGGIYLPFPLVKAETWYIETAKVRNCPAGRIPLTLFPHPAQTARIEISDSIVEYPNPVISFSVGGTVQGERFFWDLGDGTTSRSANPAYAYPYPGRYLIKLQMEDINGCAYQLESAVEVRPLKEVYIPTAFSPNGDGLNDFWTVSTYLPRLFSVEVYNRFGNLVFQSEQPDFQWDGRDAQGNLLPIGSYAYRLSFIDFVDNQQFRSGMLTLLR